MPVGIRGLCSFINAMMVRIGNLSSSLCSMITVTSRIRMYHEFMCLNVLMPRIYS